jgi:hypothetical protein
VKWEDVPEADKRRILFTPCVTREGLAVWLRRFLGIDLPDTIVDPASNSTPMDLVWELYSKALANNDPDFNIVLGYAAREAMKTLATAVIEVLCLVHLDRSGVHLAAIEQQSKKAQSYVKDFFNRPLLRDHVVLDNDRKKVVARYVHKSDGSVLTPKQFQRLPEPLRLEYKEIKSDIVIVVATLAAVNGQHAPFVCCDELDVMSNPRVYEESKLIASPYMGKTPITFLTSTRKFSFGIVQKEIDEADKSGLKVRHWNIIDVTERCPVDRHLPHEPKVDAYYSDETLVTIGKKSYDALSPEQQGKYKHDTAYAGCLSRCKLFAMCRGRLATKQKAKDPKSKVQSMLKPVTHVQAQFAKTSLDLAQAQLLCRKPSTTGLIYPGFDRAIHMLSPAQMLEMVTGEEQPENLTKAQLIEALKARGVKFYAGMDFGYTHNWTVVLGFVDGPRCFVIDAIAQAELEVEQQVEIAKGRILHYQPKIYADPENPQAIISFRKGGFKIQKVEKGPGSVVSGIELVRAKLRPALGEPKLFFLKNETDTAIDLLAKHTGAYHWKLDAAGEPSDVPDEKDDDLPDSLRYLIMGLFGKSGKVVAAREKPSAIPEGQQPVYHAHDWMKKTIAERTGDPAAAGAGGGVKGKKGNFFFDLG